MKLKPLSYLAVISAISISAVIGQAQYSGIYSGTIEGTGFSVALTKGGRALGASTDAESWADVLNPAVSKVNAKGVFKGATPNGASINATISGTKITGTVKDGEYTVRLTGKRIYN